jgi:hypothetical protein
MWMEFECGAQSVAEPPLARVNTFSGLCVVVPGFYWMKKFRQAFFEFFLRLFSWEADRLEGQNSPGMNVARRFSMRSESDNPVTMPCSAIWR